MDKKEIDEKESAAKKAEAQVQYWLKEIASARKREKGYRKVAKEVVELYEGQRQKNHQYNILYSNTDTLLPALYNTTPRPVAQRRYKDTDPLGKAGSQVTQRVLEFLIDDGEQEYSTFDDLMRAATLEGLVPGRGVTRFKYDAKFEKTTSENGEEAEKVSYEKVCGEEVPWDRFLHGYGKKWRQVPWVSYEHHMTSDELVDNFGAWAAAIPVEDAETDIGEEGQRTSEKREEVADVKTVLVYEIWSKLHKKVIFVSPSWPERVLKEEEDPLGLTGFFPSPRPLTFIQKISTLTPVTLYTMYKEQAEELDTVTLRLNKLIAACRVRGMYDNTVQDIDKALEAEDNVMVPVTNVAAMTAQGMSLEKSFWIFPLAEISAVIQQLYIARQNIKSVIFEITGLADIMRGSSQASETLGAQEIKNQWGTLRLKRTQKEVARYVRDSLRIMAEIAVSKLGQDTIQQMTGLPFPTEEQKAQQQMVVQQMQTAGQQPPLAMMQALEQPSWEQILQLLKDDLTRSYRIDIETNSTVDAEATEDKQNISELLNALAQFMSGVAPLVESGVMPFEVAQTMLMTITRRFRFGTDVEDALKMMKPPTPPDDGKAKAEKAKLEHEMQVSKAEFAQKQQLAQMELQIAQAEHHMKMAEMRLNHAIKMKELQAKERALGIKAQVDTMTAGVKMRQASQQAVLGAQQHQQQLEANEQNSELNQQKVALQGQELSQKAEFGKQQNKIKSQQLRQQAQQGKGPVKK